VATTDPHDANGVALNNRVTAASQARAIQSIAVVGGGGEAGARRRGVARRFSMCVGNWYGRGGTLRRRLVAISGGVR